MKTRVDENCDEVEHELVTEERRGVTICENAINAFGLPRLIPQAVHENLPAISLKDEVVIEFLISQRDCVENLVRNVFNFSFLYPNGTLRPGVENQLSDSALGRYFTGNSDISLVSNDIECGRCWLNETVGFEKFGVMYDPLQGNREVLTGIDNILSLMEGMTFKNSSCVEEKKSEAVSCLRSETDTQFKSTDTLQPEPDSATTPPIQSMNSKTRAHRLTTMCKFLSNETMLVTWNKNPNILNYSDVTLSFKYYNGVKKVTEKVK